MGKGKHIIAVISGLLCISAVVLSIAIKIKFNQGIEDTFFSRKKEKHFELEEFMEKRGYQLDLYKKVDFNQDGTSDFVATGIKKSEGKEAWQLFLIDGKQYEVVDSVLGEVWPEGHRLEVQAINGVYHIIYCYTQAYGESKAYEIIQGNKLKAASFTGHNYWIDKVGVHQIKVRFEGEISSQVFMISEKAEEALGKQFSYFTYGASYYFEGDYLVNMQHLSFPDIYETAGLGLNLYYEWKNNKWSLARVVYSNGPEFTMVQ